MTTATQTATYELKAIKTFASDCGFDPFDANIYRNGKKIGSVCNSGDGGGNAYHFTDWSMEDTVMEELRQYARENATEEWMLDGLDSEYAELEDWAVEIMLESAEYNRLSKKRVLFKKSAFTSEIHSVDASLDRQSAVNYILSEYPQALVWVVTVQKWV
jgi:hypothetical protein